jgi:hypothetical protein
MHLIRVMVAICILQAGAYLSRKVGSPCDAVGLGEPAARIVSPVRMGC